MSFQNFGAPFRVEGAVLRVLLEGSYFGLSKGSRTVSEALGSKPCPLEPGSLKPRRL